MTDLPERRMYRSLKTDAVTRQEIYDSFCKAKGRHCPVQNGGSCQDCHKELYDIIHANVEMARDLRKLLLWRMHRAGRGEFEVIDFDNEDGSKKPIRYWHQNIKVTPEELVRRILG